MNSEKEVSVVVEKLTKKAMPIIKVTKLSNGRWRCVCERKNYVSKIDGAPQNDEAVLVGEKNEYES